MKKKLSNIAVILASLLVSVGAIAAVSLSPVRVIPLGDLDLATVIVHPGGTVLSFPVKPKKVILGKQGVFDVEYVANDVALSPLKLAGESQLFVYMLGRRFTFYLKIGTNSGNKIVTIRDPKENSVEIYIDE